MKTPTIKQCFEYSNNMEQSIAFHTHFESIDWMVGKRGNAKPMSNWKSALTGWIKRSKLKESKIETALANTNTTIIDKLWKRMAEIYGHKWVSSYGTHPTKPWAELFNSMNPLKIKHGLDLMLKNGDDWPPSLVKFSGLCNSYRQPIKSLSHLPDRQQILKQRELTANTRIKELNRIRGIL